MRLAVGAIAGPPADQRDVEIVERKGLGHPDSICDALAEEIGKALSRHYRNEFGLILHHNVDKVLLCAGEAAADFNGGEVTAPIEIYLSGRATTEFKGKSVPVEQIALEAAERWIEENMNALDPVVHLRLIPRIRPGSADLAELYLRHHEQGIRLANDTSCGVGYAPLSELEAVVYAVEHELNAPSIRRRHPEMGEDVKVMGVRQGDTIALTVARAFIGRFLSDPGEYLESKTAVTEIAANAARRHTTCDVTVRVNTADDLEAGSLYLTVTGTSAEAGDDGEAGRGNRVNGLIAPYRPMTMESVAGKNPVTHVGKLYNLCAGLIADDIVRTVPEAAEAQCCLVSAIGEPIEEPQIADLRVRSADGGPVETMAAAVEEIARARLAAMRTLCDDLIDGRIGIDRWPLGMG